MKTLLFAVVLIAAKSVEARSSCSGYLEKINRATLQKSLILGKRFVRETRNNIQESKGLILTGKNPKQVVHPSDEVAWGFFSVYRPEAGKGFWDAPGRNASQLIPRYVLSPVIRATTRNRHSPGTLYNLTALPGVYRYATRWILGTKHFEKSKYFKKELVPNFITDTLIGTVAPLALYFSLFNPFDWFEKTEEKINSAKEDQQYLNLINFDPRFADIKLISGTENQIRAAKNRLKEMKYFMNKIISFLSESRGFNNPDPRSYELALAVLQDQKDIEDIQDPAAEIIVRRFELAGTTEFSFLHQMGAEEFQQGTYYSLGAQFPLKIEVQDAHRHAQLISSSLESFMIMDKMIISQLEVFTQMIALDQQLFGVNAEWVSHGLLNDAQEQLKADANINYLLNSKLTKHIKRGVALSYLDFKAKLAALKIAGLMYTLQDSSGSNHQITEKQGFRLIYANIMNLN